jgi:hypothetical protein
MKKERGSRKGEEGGGNRTTEIGGQRLKEEGAGWSTDQEE